MITVMIAEDNILLSKKYAEFLTKDKNINIVCSVTDGKEAIKKYKEIRPDILILDLQLPTVNGVDIINNLSLEEQERKKCNIIVVSGTNELRYNLFNTCKIYRIFPKPVNIDDILISIKQISDDIITSTTLDNNIKKFLFSLNFNLYSDGTQYLIEAIKLASNNPTLLKNIKNIYHIISIRHSVSEDSVKWSIRNAIDTMNKNTNNSELTSKLNISLYRKITPKLFITIILSQFNYLLSN